MQEDTILETVAVNKETNQPILANFFELTS